MHAMIGHDGRQARRVEKRKYKRERRVHSLHDSIDSRPEAVSDLDV